MNGINNTFGEHLTCLHLLFIYVEDFVTLMEFDAFSILDDREHNNDNNTYLAL